MDMEWAKDGETGELFIVQARPETVQSRAEAGIFRSYRITSKGRRLVTGLSIGDAVVAGKVCLIESPQEIDRFVDGAVLVTGTTDPDWVPIMKRAAAIVTDHGGRTSHAAIVSRELGLPAIVGTGDATRVLHDEQEITVSCAEGDEGFVYEGTADFEVDARWTSPACPRPGPKVMLNLANPAAAFRWWRIPADGVGLARMEFVVSNHDQGSPDGAGALRHAEGRGGEEGDRRPHRRLWTDKTEYFVDTLARGLARIAARAVPEPGHRADERLQDQRIRQPDRRRRVRADGGEPDARLPRRVALLLATATARASRSNAAPSGACGTRWAFAT